MQYTSPLSLFPAGSKAVSPGDVRLVKKRLLAEFELTGSTTVMAGGKEMDKNSVLKNIRRATAA